MIIITTFGRYCQYTIENANTKFPDLIKLDYMGSAILL